MSAPFAPPGSLVVCRPESLLFWPYARQGITLLSDIHLGSSVVDEGLLIQELEAARKAQDRVLLNGDVFDAILPGDAKRYDPSALHPRIRGRADVLNAALEWADELFAPYAHLIDVIGRGNHESSCVKYSSFDPTLALLEKLNDRLQDKGLPRRISYGGYCGFVCYDVDCGKRNLHIYYHHGWGKGASLSAAASQYNACGWLEGVDVIWLSHLHARFNAHTVKVRPPAKGYDPVHREVRFVRTGAYTDHFRGSTQETLLKQGCSASYAADAGHSPHGRGGARLELTFSPDGDYSLTVTQ